MSRYKVFAGVAAAAILALAAGCGAPGGSPSSTSTLSPGQVASLYHKLGQCIRSHGLPDFPDPVKNQQTGNWDLAPGASAPPQRVLNACQSIIARLPSQGNSQGSRISSSELAQYRRFAQCMRRQGLLSWPDPNPDGTFTLPAGMSSVRGAYQKQMAACNTYAPAAGIHFTVSGQSTSGGGQ